MAPPPRRGFALTKHAHKIIEITKDEEWNINFELELINVGVAIEQASDLVNAVQSLTVSVPDHIKADGGNAEASYRKAIANGLEGEELDNFINSPRFDAGIQIMNTYDALVDEYGNNIPEKYINETLNDLETLMFDPNVIIQTGCASGPDLGLCDTMDKRQAMELTIEKYLNGELTGEQKTIIESNIGLYMKCLAQLSVISVRDLDFKVESEANVMKDLDKKLDQWGSSWMQLANDVRAGEIVSVPDKVRGDLDGYYAGMFDTVPEGLESIKFLAALATNKDGLRDELSEMIKNDITGTLVGIFNDLQTTNAVMSAAVGNTQDETFWNNYASGMMMTETATGAALFKAFKAIKAAKTVKLAKKPLKNFFNNEAKPKGSDLKLWAEAQGWSFNQTANGPLKYVDSNGVVRLTIKGGSNRAPGSASPHIEVRNASGQRIDPKTGEPVPRKSPENHTEIDFDL